MKKGTIASLLGVLAVGFVGGYFFSEMRRPKIYYHASDLASPPAMEDEDHTDPSQVRSIARMIEEEGIYQRLKAKLGEGAHIRVVWNGDGYRTKCMVEISGGSLAQKDFEEVIRQASIESFAKAEKLWAERVTEWEKKKAAAAQRP